MAVITLNFRSIALKMSTTVTVVLPDSVRIGDTPISDHSDDDELIAEPKIMRVHKAAERSSKLISRVKELHGYTCEICLMNFEDKYGIFGRHFIEAHHLTPFSELPEDKVVLLSPRDDFAVVCSNCHSMLHRKGAPENFDEFREYYQKLAKI